MSTLLTWIHGLIWKWECQNTKQDKHAQEEINRDREH